ncbi:MAG TPA: Rne/Rng family ribonuclease [Myxococcota bacterium]|nr:Rne/Rng family ribonuclease [Myxococcota bacterium]
MQNEIIINAAEGETRVALVERGTFVELHLERRDERSVVGSVVKGRVTRVLPGMQAAFVDIGLDKAAFLYAGDYLEDTGPVDFEDEDEEQPRPRGGRGGRGRISRREPPKIDTLLREGQEIVVQVAKEPIGTKGARITSHVSIAGRHLVLTPWSQRVGVSRRIDTDRERRRLREIVERFRPRDLGFIIRTAGESAREADLEADVRYLTAVWDEIQIKQDEVRAPAVLASELSLPLRVIRDFANQETKRIVVDSPKVYEEMKTFVSRFVADPKPRIEHYTGAKPVFDEFGIEAQIDANLGRKVWLKSGGYLIVDQSEALTAIDVNTGRYVGKRELEDTVLKTNLEAVREIVYQLRFRNIGGLIILDLIDMESSENREKVYRALQEALRSDKAKTNILKISELGLVEMTRKRTRENLVQQLCEPCEYCEGRGYVLSRQSVAYKVLREIRKDLPRFRGRRIAIVVNSRVAEQLLGAERTSLAELERELGREIEVRARPSLHHEQFEVVSVDEAGPRLALSIPWLGLGAPAASEPARKAAELAGVSLEGPETDATAAWDAPAGEAPLEEGRPASDAGPAIDLALALEPRGFEAGPGAPPADEALSTPPAAEPAAFGVAPSEGRGDDGEATEDPATRG